MRCIACDCNLNDFESTRKFASGGFIDLCNRCFYSGVHQQIHAVEREDLRGAGVISDEDSEVVLDNEE